MMLHCRTISVLATVFVCFYVTDAAATVVCYVGLAGGAEEVAWLAAVTDVEPFDTNSDNLCHANEIPPSLCPLADDTDLGQLLTFDKANTGLTRSFTVGTVKTNYNFVFNEPGLGGTTDRLTVGRGTSDHADDDWEMVISDGRSLYAFAFHLLENDVGYGPDEFRVYGQEGLQGTCQVTENHDTQFVGVLSGRPIMSIEFDEDSEVDNIAIADFRFALPADVPAVSEWGLAAMTLLVLAAGSVVIRRQRRTV